MELSFGDVAVTEQVVAYQRKSTRDGSTLEQLPLVMPETTFETEAIWFLPGPSSSPVSSSCRCCSARSTPPSTR